MVSKIDRAVSLEQMVKLWGVNLLNTHTTRAHSLYDRAEIDKKVVNRDTFIDCYLMIKYVEYRLESYNT